MTTKHTPGPWTTYISEWPSKVEVRKMANDGLCNVETVHIATCHGNAENARRIVACVNACEGIADPSAVKDLLDMCMAAERLLDPMTHNPASDDFMRELRAAISKATGTNQ